MSFFRIIKGELDILVSSSAFQKLEANERALVLGFLHQLVLAVLAVLERPVSTCWPWPTSSDVPYSSTLHVTGAETPSGSLTS